jgi:hypothetical protein
MSLNVSKTKYIIFHVQGKRIERGTTLQIDANLPDTAHNPDLVATVERIHSKHANYDTQACKLLGIYLDEHLNDKTINDKILYFPSCTEANILHI